MTSAANIAIRQEEPRQERRLDLRWALDELRADGLIDRRQAADMLAAPRRERDAGLHPFEIIAQRDLPNPLHPPGKLDLEALTGWLAERCGQAYLRIEPLKVDIASVTEVMSYAFAKRHGILAVAASDREVVVASAQPGLRQWEGLLAQTLGGRTLRRVLSNPADIRRYALEWYSMARSVAKASREGGRFSPAASFEQLLELNRQAPEANDSHIVRIVDWLLQYAYEQRASDIHIEPRGERAQIRFRIDGLLHQVYELPAAVNAAAISRLKSLGRMDLAERRRPQDGRIKTKRPTGEEVELRLSTLPTAFGEKLVARIFAPEVLLRSFPQLGLDGEDRQRWEAMTRAASGILLVTGPTGAGKTTTLYSSLKQLASSKVNVCTVEDPIEMIEPAFNQLQVQPGIGLNFAAAIPALLRQDPDILMIGEIRDLQTAEMAVQAALTGHLVLSTLHTGDAPSAIARLLDLGIPAYMIRAAVLGVMAQRLARTLCPHCKAEEAADAEDWRLLVQPFAAERPARIFASRGCLECRGTGFRGRVGLYQVLRLSPAVQAHIRENTDLAALSRQAQAEGMRSLSFAGARQVQAGLTTVAEVLRVTGEPSAGEREGLAPRMKKPSAGEREGLAPRMKEPSAGEREGEPLA